MSDLNVPIGSPKPQTEPIKEPEKTVFEEIKLLLGQIFNLRNGLDRWGTIAAIKEAINLKGTNVWLLISGLVIACIGLDTGSVAVIIGAMLISPLMGPILGIGLGVGINDRKMIILSFYNLSIALIISLIVATIYFSLTPLGEPTKEIMSRTRPHILDVFVAFFGGIAGIVASSRKEKLNAVPGVAIATALLPPLCVTGFGIANFDWKIVWGSFYLFFLNSVFVALATFIVIRLLNFPLQKFLNRSAKIRTNIFVGLFVILTSIPASLMLVTVISEVNEKSTIKSFIENEINNEKNQVLKHILYEVKGEKVLKVFAVGDFMKEDQIQKLSDKLTLLGVNRKLKITQLSKPPENFEDLSEDIKISILESLELKK